MATATRVKGHALKADGAAFNEMGERLYPKTTSGTGSARCECRELSPEYGTRKERVDWHKAHKLRHAAEAPVTREEAPLDKARKVEFPHAKKWWKARSEEHTSELQSRGHLVCRLLLEKKKTKYIETRSIQHYI